MIDVGAQYDRAHWPHQEARAECRQRQHEGREFVAAGKEGLRNRERVITKNLKVVHFQRISRGDTYDRLELGLAGRRSPGLDQHRNLSSKNTCAGVRMAIRQWNGRTARTSRDAARTHGTRRTVLPCIRPNIHLYLYFAPVFIFEPLNL